TKPLERLHDVGRRDLATQMQIMIGTQASVGLRLFDGVGQNSHFAGCKTTVFIRPHAQTVEDRGDAGCRDLGVMRLDGSERVPSHTWAWCVMTFQMVCVKLHQPWQQVVA